MSTACACSMSRNGAVPPSVSLPHTGIEVEAAYSLRVAASHILIGSSDQYGRYSSSALAICLACCRFHSEWSSA